MPIKPNDPIDRLETMILLALDANHEQSAVDRTLKSSHGTLDLLDQGTLLHFEEMRPATSYTVDATADRGHRLYSTSSEMLLDHPSEIVGDEAEIMLLGDHGLKWYGFRRLKQAPKRAAYIGKPSHWYEMHMRFVAPNGQGEYTKRVVAVDKNGKPLLVKLDSHVVCHPNLEGVNLILAASLIEDAHRSGTMLASVRDATEIRFPVPLDDYKEVFAERDGPLNGSRRKAILHWVAEHLRRSPRGNEHVVKKHTRGVQEFIIDGLHVRLVPNDGKEENK